MTIVFDIDGTLSLVGDRVKHLSETPPNWDRFYERCGEDEPNWPILNVLDGHNAIEDAVILLTGRRESVRSETEDWLDIHQIRYRKLLMRPDGDTRHDTIVKPELLEKAGIVPDLIFEDRNSMVQHWRKLGFTCCQVAEGDF